MNAVEPRAGHIFALWVCIDERAAITLRVPFFARRCASLAADAGVEVDHEAEFFGGGIEWEGGHEKPLIRRFATPSPSRGEGKNFTTFSP